MLYVQVYQANNTSKYSVFFEESHPHNKHKTVNYCCFNPLTAGAAYNQVFIFYYHIKCHILNKLKIKRDINQQDLKRVDLRFVKSE